MSTVIEIKNISKKYLINRTQQTPLFRDTVYSFMTKPLKRFGSLISPSTSSLLKKEFWALRNINLNINKGEVIGITGKNGSGKSTLLKILSRVTTPTEGEIILNGKVSSLLEVGTGFHPELSGRENIFLNGSILGMSKSQISEKFSEIVAFAEVEEFLDEPIKHYSSGMKVRLAFSVASHLDPDILIIDEVLSVGDKDFRKKSLEKIKEVTKSKNMTVIVVSHSDEIIRSICTKVVTLEKGALVANE